MPSTISSDAGFELGEGETLVPGSVHTSEPTGEPATSAAKAAEEASASDAAPPVPQADADTNI
jgi:hypothetical protein